VAFEQRLLSERRNSGHIIDDTGGNRVVGSHSRLNLRSRFGVLNAVSRRSA
jgi:hypothetical protein